MSEAAVLTRTEKRLCPHCGAHREEGDGALLPVGWSCTACNWAPTFEAGVALTTPEDRGRIVGVDPAAFSQLNAVEAGHFWFESRRNLIVHLLTRLSPNAQSYLEMGCGGGFVLSRIAAARPWKRIVGVELHAEGLSIARVRLPANVELIQAGADTPLAESAFDAVGAYDVIEHIPDDVGALKAMHRLLRPGGLALITVPQHMWLWSEADDLALHQRRYQRGELEQKFRNAGFELVMSSSFNALLMPLAMISRLAPSKKSTEERLQQEARPGPALNAALRGVLEIETGLTRAGLRWPLGVSRVVAARKL